MATAPALLENRTRLIGLLDKGFQLIGALFYIVNRILPEVYLSYMHFHISIYLMYVNIYILIVNLRQCLRS